MFGKIMALLIIVFVIYILYTVMNTEIETPRQKKEFSQNDKDKIAIEAMSGKTSIEDIAEREYLTEEEISDWKEDFEKKAVDFAQNKNAMYSKIGQLEMDIKWFTETCEKFIGEDWKEKTGYDKRNI